MPFFGLPLASAAFDHVQLSETRFARGVFLPLHRHDDAYLTFVLSGAYRERAAGQTRDCEARTLVLHPAGDTHEDDFAQKPTRCLNAVLAPSFVRKLGAAGAALHRGGVVAAPQLAAIGERISSELRARERIAGGVELSVIATEAGFADQSHFTRTFRKLLGVSPAEYRRRLR